ncbi:periplasmic sensor signal transduction histidine kinase [Caballeronia glathei]|jgi:two-component system OmpR family sensor kinase|uniref:histidine kinase n=1 Tax=Caballeronia glathei TaxID=60547 RepID=A0A069PQT3_9BURK|nr:ATP-binding protein [Caballeronia glathei]KDR42209.1 histidine kinase [Caballeronia glathei]CDY77206.1 periplasmic sensor signal transduction histidine kinase [Caballeronia glathei]
MTHSLQLKLSAWFAVLVAGIAMIAGIVAFETALHEANELQDGQLKQVAALVTHRSLPVMELAALENVPGADRESKLIVQSLSERTPLALAINLPDGIQNATVEGMSWRIFVKTLDGDTRVVVGQPTLGRDEIARNSALATTMPLVILVPVLLLVLGFVVRRMFRPLTTLARDLDTRTDNDFSELSGAALPTEIVPFVVAINRLLARVAQSVALQRRFVADAAHELRSPVTALSLQAERLAASEMSSQARDRLGSLRRGLARTRALLDQLLTLARVQDQGNAQWMDVSMQRVFRQVLEELMPLAEAKRIDLGVVSEVDALVRVPEMDLRILIRNLVDNAVRYTPAGGRIDLAVRETGERVQVQLDDTGPGIPWDERERVFDPFYRVLGSDEEGSGLGLSIVGTIAARIGATVELGDALPHGLRVSVTFAAASQR